MEDKKILEVENLSISFTQYVEGLNQRELKVISDLTIDVKKGEIVAILGSSGSGKSLLAHSILGILPYNSLVTGNIKYKGELLNQKRKEELRGKEICLVPQSVNFLDPLMKVYKQAIGECETEEEEAQKRKHQREIFEKYDLDESVDNLYPFELSGGMARKVLLSTALLDDPDLVVADEPTPGLDSKSIDEAVRDFKNLSKENKAILLITHDIDFAMRTAHRIAIFYAGYVIEINNTENFIKQEGLLHPFTNSLVESLPRNGFNLTDGLQPDGDLPGCIYYENCKNRMDKCKDVKPELKDVNDIKVRCFLYEEDD